MPYIIFLALFPFYTHLSVYGCFFIFLMLLCIEIFLEEIFVLIRQFMLMPCSI
jgi:hypothetical protein